MNAAGLRPLTGAERAAFAAAVHRTVAAVDVHQAGTEISLLAALRGFPGWIRVGTPALEPAHHATVALFRATSTDAYALFCVRDHPDALDAGVDAGRAAETEALLVASAHARVGTYLDLWEDTLTATPPMTRTPLLFAAHMPRQPEGTQVLAGLLGLRDRTYRAAAQARRPELVPGPGLVRAEVDKALWSATPEARDRVVTWALEEARACAARLSDIYVAEHPEDARLAVEEHLERFLDAQRDHDPHGAGRAPIR